MSSANEKAINDEMISIKHRYLEIQEQLRMAEKVNYYAKFIVLFEYYNKL